MTNEIKTALFEKMLELEHLSEKYCEGHTYDNRDYFAESNGFYEALEMLGIGREYLQWAVGK